AGAFPTWLAPVQVVICPVADRHNDHCSSVADDMRARGVRVEVDNRREKIGHKVRDAKLQKVPYILVIGDRDIEGGTAGVNPREGEEQRGVPLAEFTERVVEKIRSRARS
ncbi:MAG: His/Gly/Thr/Pro-type tRNA ligase C-terminal domain-containing protein, partial [Actinomycetota bacterium]